MFKFCIFIALFGFFQISKQNSLLESAETIEKTFNREFTSFAQTGVVSSELLELYDVLRLPNEVRYTEIGDLPEAASIATCLACRATISTFINYRRKDNMTMEQISVLAIELCQRLNIQTDYVCQNMVGEMAPILLYIVDNYPEVGAHDTCAIVAQSEKCGEPKHEMFDLEIEVDGNVPEIKGHKEASPRSGETYKIIYIGDIHYDPSYMVSGNAVCDEPTCCRVNQGPPSDPKGAAGRWGDYRNCDMPLETLRNAFHTMNQLHGDADHVYFAGDIIDHGVWETSTYGNIINIETIMALMKIELPLVPIFATLGNHEAHPVNIYAPSYITEPSLSSKWLFDYISSLWSQWLPESSLATVKKGGYYTTLIAPRYRLIVLNNNDCYTYNFWLLTGANQLREQLQWLHDTLLQAEKNGEKVHIMRHIPISSSDAFRYWTREYMRIVERFSHVIAAHFEGHTHKNEIGVFYDRENVEHAINVAFNAGSLTTYSFLNPNFMVLYVDKESLEVLDMESYMFNLTEANLHPYDNPKWFESYSFKQFWGLEDLSPKSINGLVERLVADKSEAAKYFKQKTKEGDLQGECSDKCLNSHICRIVSNEFGDERKCKQLNLK
ncbi:sphingomyelin phosphodiesterase-like [Culicoides brevitarsis]|uniref:sphingomyelin phosphodiesterase-like n=1 Tax=Culicoides brevitarsis TaxID=469753 RepID=UPI00307BEB16